MIRTWTKIGEEYSRDNQERIAGMIERLQWRSLLCQMGMMPGEAIKTAIKAFHIPKVSLVANSPEMAPLGLLAIEGNYKNGRARIYLVDDGVSLTPICSDHYEIEKKEVQP
jgi:hypothetical protein